MNFEKFKIIITCLEKVRDRSHSIHKLGVDLLDYDEEYHVAITVLLKTVFAEEGYDWISWYLYEKTSFRGETNHATDENGNEICHNVESLWDTVKPYIKQ